MPASDKALWAAQDAVSEALPSALSRAFCGVQQQFFETSKARPKPCSSQSDLASNGWQVRFLRTHKGVSSMMLRYTVVSALLVCAGLPWPHQ